MAMTCFIDYIMAVYWGVRHLSFVASAVREKGMTFGQCERGGEIFACSLTGVLYFLGQMTMPRLNNLISGRFGTLTDTKIGHPIRELKISSDV